MNPNGEKIMKNKLRITMIIMTRAISGNLPG